MNKLLAIDIDILGLLANIDGYINFPLLRIQKWLQFAPEPRLVLHSMAVLSGSMDDTVSWIGAENRHKFWRFTTISSRLFLVAISAIFGRFGNRCRIWKNIASAH
jgi:hypothetical protein